MLVKYQNVKESRRNIIFWYFIEKNLLVDDAFEG